MENFPEAVQKPLPELLTKHDLPPGLFPKNITGYKFDEKTKKIIVNMPYACEVRGNSSPLRFSNTVTGYLEKGELSEIKGMKMQSDTWREVNRIEIKQSGKDKNLHFTGTALDKVRPFDEYTTLKDGTMEQEPLPELLTKHDLPPGLFPKNITGYKFDDKTKKITVNMPYACEVRGNSSPLRFSNTVTGYLEKGELSEIKGMKMQSDTWREVNRIEIKQSGKDKNLHFTGTALDKVRPFDEYTTLRDGTMEQEPLPELLTKHDLPPGLFPKNITGYKFDEKTKKITVNMPYACEVRGNSSPLRFSNTVTGCLEKGELSEIKGMKMQSDRWREVNRIEIKQSGKDKNLHFTGTALDKVRPFDEYTTLKDGTMEQEPLPELLTKHDLPPGLFPKNITGYKFDEKTKKITVNMPYACEVRGNSSPLRFSNTVTGCLEKGKLSEIKGMKMQSDTWREVNCIKIKQSGKDKNLHFTGTALDKVRPFDEYTTLKDGTMEQEPLPELLTKHDLPPGLFPKNITGYKFDDKTKEITINMPRACDVGNNSSPLRLSNTVIGRLEKGKLSEIKGMKMQSFTWGEVNCIKIKQSGKDKNLHFTGTALDKVRPFDEYTTLKDGIPF